MTESPYRSDRDADLARIGALESEVALVRTQLEARDAEPRALVLASQRNDMVAIERTFDVRLSAEQLSVLVDRIRELTRTRGRTELTPTGASWWAKETEGEAGMCITISVSSTSTRLVATDGLTSLRDRVGIAVLASIAIALPATVAAGVIALPLAPVLACTWVAGSIAGVRTAAPRQARQRSLKLAELCDALGAAIEDTQRVPSTA